MLKKISLLVVVLFSVVIFNSCSKESVALNKIEGTWKVDAYIFNGTSIPLGSTVIKMTFNKCKAKDAVCTGSFNEDGDIESFTYSISEDGTEVTLYPGTIDEEVWNIDELSKTDLSLSISDGTDTLELKMTKE